MGTLGFLYTCFPLKSLHMSDNVLTFSNFLNKIEPVFFKQNEPQYLDRNGVINCYCIFLVLFIKVCLTKKHWDGPARCAQQH